LSAFGGLCLGSAYRPNDIDFQLFVESKIVKKQNQRRKQDSLLISGGENEMATEVQILKMASMMLLCGVPQPIIDQATAGAVRSRPKKTKGTKLVLAGSFEEFWLVFPRRDGASPKHVAELKFIAAIKSGEKPEIIIAAAVRLGSEWKHRLERKLGDSKFIPMAATWLHQKRWLDGPSGRPPDGGETMFDLADHFEQRVRDQGNEQRSDDDGGHYRR
jgi:hypothetical protein